MTVRMGAALQVVLMASSLLGCGDEPVHVDAPAPHLPVRVMILPFQFIDTEMRLRDKSADLSDVAAHLRVELLRIGVAETLETIDGLIRVPAGPVWIIGGGFAPEAAGFLGAGISTRHRWFGSEPYVGDRRGQPIEARAELVVRGSPVTVSHRALVRLRLADGRDRVIDDFFVDVHGVGEGLTPEEAMQRIGTTVAEVTRLSGPARIAEWLPMALDAVDGSAGELLRLVAIQPLPLWSMMLGIMGRPQMEELVTTAPLVSAELRNISIALRDVSVMGGPQVKELEPLFRSVLDRGLEGPEGGFYTALAPWVWDQVYAQLWNAMTGPRSSDEGPSRWIARFGEPYDLPADPDSLAHHILEHLDGVPSGPRLSPDLERLSVDIERRVRAHLTGNPLSRKPLLLAVLDNRPADSEVWTELAIASRELECWGGAYLLVRWIDPWFGVSDLYYLLRLGEIPAPERLDRTPDRIHEGLVPSRYLRDAPRPLQQRFARPHLPGTIRWRGQATLAEQGYPHALGVRAAWLRYRVASDPGGIDLDVQRILREYEDRLRGIGFPPDPARFADPDAPTHAEIQGLLAEYEMGVRELSFPSRQFVTAYQTTQILAGIAAMRGEHEEALTRLESVHRTGLLPLADLEHDPAFMDLRHRPRFQAMIDDRYRLLEAERRLWERFKDTPPSAAVLREVGETCLKSVEAFEGLNEEPSPSR